MLVLERRVAVTRGHVYLVGAEMRCTECFHAMRRGGRGWTCARGHVHVPAPKRTFLVPGDFA